MRAREIWNQTQSKVRADRDAPSCADAGQTGQATYESPEQRVDLANNNPTAALSAGRDNPGRSAPGGSLNATTGSLNAVAGSLSAVAGSANDIGSMKYHHVAILTGVVAAASVGLAKLFG